MFGFEPVLCWDVWYVMCDVRKNHLLECLILSSLFCMIATLHPWSRRNVNEEEVQPYRERDYNPMKYILSFASYHIYSLKMLI